MAFFPSRTSNFLPLSDAKRTNKIIDSEFNDMLASQYPYPGSEKKVDKKDKGKLFSFNAQQPKTLFPHFLTKRLESPQIHRFMCQFPPPGQDEFDIECKKLRAVGFYHYQRQAALMDFVLMEMACADEHIKCDVCQFPLPNVFSLRNKVLREQCVNCEIQLELKDQIPKAITALQEASELPDPLALIPHVNAVTAFKQGSAVHVWQDAVVSLVLFAHAFSETLV